MFSRFASQRNVSLFTGKLWMQRKNVGMLRRLNRGASTSSSAFSIIDGIFLNIDENNKETMSTEQAAAAAASTTQQRIHHGIAGIINIIERTRTGVWNLRLLWKQWMNCWKEER
jgi:hypothetical protein